MLVLLFLLSFIWITYLCVPVHICICLCASNRRSRRSVDEWIVWSWIWSRACWCASVSAQTLIFHEWYGCDLSQCSRRVFRNGREGPTRHKTSEVKGSHWPHIYTTASQINLSEDEKNGKELRKRRVKGEERRWIPQWKWGRKRSKGRRRRKRCTRKKGKACSRKGRRGGGEEGRERKQQRQNRKSSIFDSFYLSA